MFQAMYQLLPHTADVRLLVRAPSREELFADALRGVMAVAEPQGATDERVRVDVEIDAPDTTTLLVDFLNETLTRSHIRRETYSNAIFRRLTDVSLTAAIEGCRVTAFGEDVKAVTLHDAEVRNDQGEWSVVLVLDI